MFRTVPLYIIRSFSLYTQQRYMSYRSADSLWAGAYAPAHKLSANLYDIYHCCVYSKRTPDDVQRNCPKHVDFHSINKYEKFLHLVGYNIKIYHDTRSHERQTLWYERTQPGSGQLSQFRADGPLMVSNWTVRVLTNSHWSHVCMMDVVLKSHGQAHVKTTCIAPALKLSSIRKQKRWTAMLYASCQKNWSIYATLQTGLVLVINYMLKQIKEDNVSSSSQSER